MENEEDFKIVGRSYNLIIFDEVDLGKNEEEFFEYDPFLSDSEADADALRNIGWGTDEDYGYFDDDPY